MKRKVKNLILKSISIFAFMLMILCMSGIDSATSCKPYVIIIVCLCWLVPFGIANGVIKN